MRKPGTAVTITDPFVKYTSLIATGVYQPDAAQYRLAHHLQKVYARLKDYTPSHEYRRRIGLLSRALSASDHRDGAATRDLASPNHPIRRNPLFARLFARHGASASRDTLALARVLTSHQAALHVDSPKGLFLSGEVGTGKSMLLDLLADGLPSRHKRRWHFNTFMLHVFARLEVFRKTRPYLADGEAPEYSLLWLAQELVETSPILFLDEFQMPDRAASKIMSHLFVAFFQLGGVLVASSNRMPEDLEKATGGCFQPPATGGLIEKLLGLGKARFSGELYGPSSDFAAFLEVLKARCDFWHMEGTRDWRQRERWETPREEASSPDDEAAAVGGPFRAESPLLASAGPEEPTRHPDRPAMYFSPHDGEDAWTAAVQRLVGASSSSSSPRGAPPAWRPATLTVYGRRLVVPRQHAGIASWDFADLTSAFGPADYVTLASNYHTFVIDNVPVLTLSMKNEARRFITLLDALYEARCKLVMRAAAAGPDALFFPETRAAAARSSARDAEEDGNESDAAEADLADATYAETIAEVYQDQVAPFRPNVSYYDDAPDSSFSSSSPSSSSAAAARYDPHQETGFSDTTRGPDFTKTTPFTGEDERFAYKRAASRLWELCSARWHARSDEGWWMPLPREARHWEGGEASRPMPSALEDIARGKGRNPSGGEGMGESVELEEPAGLAAWRVRGLKEGGGSEGDNV
ncbi:hypothetical protein VTJ83DRAFT_7474 [Remersonia thermophila]|uniref:AAA+ ATPase domain-containing protein n=1 Tax=Remersonia thermophila TaxID=72144 RepID=A0ABR4D4N1_9PEZI